ncbi:MAG: hypothetical protein ACTHJI_17630 [Leifsonia sp.]
MTDAILNPDGSPWKPAFENQRPPFQPGNRVSVGNKGPRTHGASSPRIYLPLAKQIRDELVKQLDWLADGSFSALLTAYTTAEARSRLYSDWLDSQPVEVWVSEAKGTAPAELLREMVVHAGNLAVRLGLTPDTPDDVKHAIAAARTRVAARARRKAERQQLQADLRDAISAQMYPEDKQDERA